MWMDRPVYICLCNALTDRKLKQIADDGAGRRLVDVYAACGCRAQCGQCAKAILKLLRDHAAHAAEPLPAAG
jgi:bacterioferritin-associated ferredoxin